MRNGELHDRNVVGTRHWVRPCNAYNGRSGMISRCFRRYAGFDADCNTADWIDGKLQPPDRFIDPEIPVCRIGFRFLATDRSLGEAGILAVHLLIHAPHLGARALGAFTHSLMCAAISAWLTLFINISRCGPWGSCRAASRASFAALCSRSPKEMVCLRRFLLSVMELSRFGDFGKCRAKSIFGR